MAAGPGGVLARKVQGGKLGAGGSCSYCSLAVAETIRHMRVLLFLFGQGVSKTPRKEIQFGSRL